MTPFAIFAFILGVFIGTGVTLLVVAAALASAMNRGRIVFVDHPVGIGVHSPRAD